VLFKLTTLKQTLDGLAPMDDKLERIVNMPAPRSLPDLADSDEDNFNDEYINSDD